MDFIYSIFLPLPYTFRPGSIIVDAKLYFVNVDDEKRLEICQMVDRFFFPGPLTIIGGLPIIYMKIKSLGKTLEMIMQFFLFHSLQPRNQ